jgi:hypothetical protein
MDGIGSISNTSVAEAMLLRADDEKTAQALTVLKKAMNADRSMIETLLPPPPQGRLDIKA